MTVRSPGASSKVSWAEVALNQHIGNAHIIALTAAAVNKGKVTTKEEALQMKETLLSS